MPPTTDANRGLDGVTAALSAVSSIVGDTLTYRGYSIEDLGARSTFEEVAYLLWHGELPTGLALNLFAQDLRLHRSLPSQVVRWLKDLPPGADPMGVLCTSISALALHDPLVANDSPEANARKAVWLLAKLPTLVASIHRVRVGRDLAATEPKLTISAGFLALLHGRPPASDHARVLDIALIVHADHELNASTFAARVAASTLTDLYSAVVAAIVTLKGPLHGGATLRVMRMLEEIGQEDRVSPYVDAAMQRGGTIPGFGHRVYTDGDPRAKILKALSRELAGETDDDRWYQVSTNLEECVSARMGVLPNVDLYAASVYAYLGIPPDLFPAVFAMSRVSGWIAHILEQYTNNRLIRPRAEYIGVGPRSYVPVQER